MDAGERRFHSALILGLAAAMFLGAGVFLVVALLSGSPDDDVARDALPLLLGTLGLGSLALLLWRRDRAALIDLEDAAGAESSRLEAEAERARAQVEEQKQETERERAERDRVERSRRAEKRWNRELRDQVVQLHRERGVLGDTDDIRALVLRISTTLVEAEKGLLLSREDEDADGDLDLVCYEGFERNPEHSEIAQRFASEVLERDAMVREDHTGKLQAEGEEAVDEEIRNLVAIPIYIQDRFSGVVVCANRQGGFDELDDDVLLALGDHAGAVLHNGRLQGELRTAYISTVKMLADAVQAKDPFLRGHSDEVSGYVSAVAKRLDIEPGRREELVFGSLLHDVGKIGISERILLKPAALTPEERTVIQLHPRIGYRLVQQVPALAAIALGILHHHEWFDGTGYPSGLRGEQIPLEARIIAVADSFSAMTAERPYRGRVSLEEACQELERCAGTQFDPEVVRAFVAEARAQGPARAEEMALAAVLDDPELQLGRRGDEPVLGYGSMAVTDNLSLLYTHRYFHETAHSEAQRAAVQGRPFAVALVELASIAEVNRRDGYAAGDALVQAAARALQRAAVRAGGTACRYSGRRLGLIFAADDEAAAQPILAALESDLSDGLSVRTAVTVWRDGEEGDDVIARARLLLGDDTAPAPLPVGEGGADATLSPPPPPLTPPL